MRVSFFGKGGSGKTTMTVSFIKYLEEKNKKVLAVDADINVNLGNALNIETKYLGDSFEDLTDYLERDKESNKEEKKGIFKNMVSNLKENLKSDDRNIIGTTPPTLNSKFIKPSLNDKFFDKFATKKDNLALLTVGTYTDKKVGYACYHSKLGSAVLIYNRLLDNKDLYVVTDATAGVDSVGTSMFYVSDINVFVVEPTKKSVDVYKDFLEITKKFKLKNYVIGNKIRNQDDIDYIKSQINEENIIGFVEDSDSLRSYEKGNENALDDFIKDNSEINDKIYNILEKTEKDWDNYYEIQKQVYKDDCNDWYSQFYGEDLTEYIDPNFTYKEVIEKNV